jgi:hypothetical protein
MAFTWDFRKRHVYPPRAHGRAAPAEAGARARFVRVIVEVVPFRSLCYESSDRDTTLTDESTTLR